MAKDCMFSLYSKNIHLSPFLEWILVYQWCDSIAQMFSITCSLFDFFCGYQQINVVFMMIALATVFRTKHRSVARRRKLKDSNSGDKPNLDLFKYATYHIDENFWWGFNLAKWVKITKLETCMCTLWCQAFRLPNLNSASTNWEPFRQIWCLPKLPAIQFYVMY